MRRRGERGARRHESESHYASAGHAPFAPYAGPFSRRAMPVIAVTPYYADCCFTRYADAIAFLPAISSIHFVVTLRYYIDDY